MRILRSVTRRGFTVGSAGWFTITSPNRWFAASRLPRNSRYMSEAFQGIDPPAISKYSRQATSSTTVSPQIITLPPLQRHPLEQALVVLTAIAVTAVALWWIVLAR